MDCCGSILLICRSHKVLSLNTFLFAKVKFTGVGMPENINGSQVFGVTSNSLSFNVLRIVRYRVSTPPSSEVAVGSCATDARESGQGRKTAAFIGNVRVPQTTWPSLQSADAFCQLWCAKFFCNCFKALGRADPFPVGNVADRHRCNKGC
jgi:hypothetical protein